MRHIKFRGMCIETNTWVYGSLLEYQAPLRCFGPQGPSEFAICKSGSADWNMQRPMICTMVHPESIGEFTGCLDMNKKEIYEGDLIIGNKYYLKGDGYKSKKYPDTINVICAIEYSESYGFKYPKVLRPINEHKEALEKYSYRGVGYNLDPLRKGSMGYNNITKEFDIEGDGRTCLHIRIIGNLYETPDPVSF